MTGSPDAWMELLAGHEAGAGRIGQENRGIAWAEMSGRGWGVTVTWPGPRADLGGVFHPFAALQVGEPEAGQ
jgi:hypothetical protein